VTIGIPSRSGEWWIDAIIFVACSLGLVLLLTLVASATARLKLRQATRLLWRCSFVLAVISLCAAFLVRGN